MAPTEKMELLAQALKLHKAGKPGLEGFRRMSVDELRVAVEQAGSGEPSAVKAPATSNGQKSKSKSAAVVKKAVQKSSPAKSKSAEVIPAAKGEKAKRPAAKKSKAKMPSMVQGLKVKHKVAPVKAVAPSNGKKRGRVAIKAPSKTTLTAMAKTSSQAEIAAVQGVSQATVAKWYRQYGIVSKRGRKPGANGTTTPVKSKVKSSPTKAVTKAARTAGNGPRNSIKGNRSYIDNSTIDWTADSPVGNSPVGMNSGVRTEIMRLARKFKGDKQKIYDAHTLAEWKDLINESRRATSAKLTKDEVHGRVRWLIARVIFDFVTKSGQHESASGPAKRSKAAGGSKKAKVGVKSKSAPAKAQNGSKKRGRPKGIPMSEETKAKIAATRKKNKAKAARAAKAAK